MFWQKEKSYYICRPKKDEEKERRTDGEDLSLENLGKIRKIKIFKDRDGNPGFLR
jgi:hypothetical protein